MATAWRWFSLHWILTALTRLPGSGLNRRKGNASLIEWLIERGREGGKEAGREVVRYSLERISRLSILFQEMFTDWKRGSFDFHWLVLLQHSMFTKNPFRQGKEKLPSEEELGRRQKQLFQCELCFKVLAKRRKWAPSWLCKACSYLSPMNKEKTTTTKTKPG